MKAFKDDLTAQVFTMDFLRLVKLFVSRVDCPAAAFGVFASPLYSLPALVSLKCDLFMTSERVMSTAAREVQATTIRASTMAGARSTAVFCRNRRCRRKAACRPLAVITYRSASCGLCHVSHICPLRSMHDECNASGAVHFTVAIAEEKLTYVRETQSIGWM
jgi:hypothetical protein